MYSMVKGGGRLVECVIAPCDGVKESKMATNTVKVLESSALRGANNEVRSEQSTLSRALRSYVPVGESARSTPDSSSDVPASYDRDKSDR